LQKRLKQMKNYLEKAYRTVCEIQNKPIRPSLCWNQLQIQFC